MTVILPAVTPENYKDYLEFEDFPLFHGNMLKRTDTYSLSHDLIKINKDKEVSHIYARKDSMIMFGTNKIVNDLFSKTLTEREVYVAQAHAIRNGMWFPYETFMRVVSECDGKMPLIIEALPDGRWAPKGTPIMQIRQADDVQDFGEIVTWFEGVLLKLAFPSGCATRAFRMRKYLEKKQREQGELENPLFLWRIHSFGFRGQNSDEDAFWGGMAWTTFLPGTDDWHISFYYPNAEMGSIAASAHKVTQQFDSMTAMQALTAFGVFKDLPGDVVSMYYGIDQVADKAPVKVFAAPIDTYDAMHVIHHHVVDIARYAKKKGVHFVFRPDSGDVLEQAIMIYWKLKHEDLLDAAHCIIGEGIDFDVVQKNDERLEQEGIPLSFLFYGMGAGFFKDIERDTVGAAMKTAYSNGKDRMKLVLTAPEKSSIPGKVQLVIINGLLTVVPEEVAIAQNMKSEYEILYKFDASTNSTYFYKQTWEAIQAQALAQTGEQGRVAMSTEILEKIERFKQELAGDIA